MMTIEMHGFDAKKDAKLMLKPYIPNISTQTQDEFNA
jgi:hypothetical protein